MKRKNLIKWLLCVALSGMVLWAAGCSQKEIQDADQDYTGESTENVSEESAGVEEKDSDVEDSDAEDSDAEGMPEQEEGSVAAEPVCSEADLIILNDPAIYTYMNMSQDLEKLSSIYSTQISLDSLGQTMDGREIYHLVIGDPNAKIRIMINASIHGREYMTSQLVMAQMVSFLQNIENNNSYNGQSYESLLEDVVIHVVPMINPDGVSISQFGMDGVLTDEVKNRIYAIADMDGSAVDESYLTRWKANGNGIDVNRNFDALWESYEGAGHPSSDHYKGESIGCEPESAALINLTEQVGFQRTLSYHTQGSVIYWYFAQDGQLYDETLDFANAISAVTGYPTDANYEYLDPAGYKDWAISKKSIPSLTVEVGRETSPVPSAQYSQIREENKCVWEETILNAKKWNK